MIPIRLYCKRKIVPVKADPGRKADELPCGREKNREDFEIGGWAEKDHVKPIG
jgi:hypothetical protein